jgi:segregation and condensation protein A
MAFLPEGWETDPKRRRTATAANFAAALELVKAGKARAAPGRDLRADPV